MTTVNINGLLYEKIFFYRYLVLYQLEISQVTLILVWIWAIRTYHFSSKISAFVAFLLLFGCMVCNMFGLDSAAGVIAQFVFIFFVTAFIQELIQYMKHEKK